MSPHPAPEGAPAVIPPAPPSQARLGLSVGTILSIFILALALRWSAAMFLSQGIEYPDSMDFDSIAQSLVEGRGFRSMYGFGHCRGPVYPLLLAACRLVTPSHLAPRLLQGLLDSATALLLMVLAFQLGVGRLGIALVGLLYAINPYAIYFSRLLLSETLCLFLLVLTLTLFFGRCGSIPFTRGLIIGTVMGVTAMTRVVVLGVAGFLGLIELLQSPRPITARLQSLAFMTLVGAMVLAPWVLRNHEVYGRWILVTPTDGIVLYESFNPHADGGGRRLGDDWPAEFNHPNLAISNERHRAAARAWLAKNPNKFWPLAWEKQKRFWSPVPNVETFRRWPYLLAGVYELPLLLLAGMGVVLAVVTRHSLAYLAPIVMYFPALHLVFFGSLRYRLPIEPLLCLFAAWSLESLVRRLSPQSGPLKG